VAPTTDFIQRSTTRRCQIGSVAVGSAGGLVMLAGLASGFVGVAWLGLSVFLLALGAVFALALRLWSIERRGTAEPLQNQPLQNQRPQNQQAESNVK
jgi:hypothetical protein